MRINTLTITGADDQVSVNSLQTMGDRFPFIEWGILFSKGKEGTPRYPSKEWMTKLKGRSLRLSAHFCGWWSKSILEQQNFQLLDDLDPQFNRVQLNYNFMVGSGSVDGLIDYAVEHPERSFIFQYNKSNKKTLDLHLRYALPPNIHFLYDASGGRGITLETIEKPFDRHYTGYAGGIDNTNIKSVISKLELYPSPTKIWIDLESGVRDEHDQWDIVKVDRIIEACYGNMH